MNFDLMMFWVLLSILILLKVIVSQLDPYKPITEDPVLGVIFIIAIYIVLPVLSIYYTIKTAIWLARIL